MADINEGMPKTDIFAGVVEWNCPHGHGLGVVRRAKAGDHHVSRLFLFRQAVDRSEPTPESVDVIAVVEGTTLDIRCSVCGAVRTWYMGEDALERLMAKIGRR